MIEAKIIIKTEPKNLLEVLEWHLNAGKFEYLSYDHKKALEEFKLTIQYLDICDNYKHAGYQGMPKIGKHELPPELRLKHAVWKPGKIRRVEFGNYGDINRIYIGHKYAIPVYQSTIAAVRLVDIIK